MFGDAGVELTFQDDLIRYLGLNHMWSAVLANTDVYPELVNTILGRNGVLPPIEAQSRVLDLGAGTGNLSLALARQARNHRVLSVENNRTMLNLLEAKRREFLVSRPMAYSDTFESN